ncbi:MAG: ferrous iron transport protein A [Pseudobdellovibrionaceae bacterium]
MTLAEFHQKHSKSGLDSLGKSQTFKAKVQGFSGEPVLVERLKEMGLHPGLELLALGQAPFGGPLLFRFGNTVLALRQEEAACTLIEIL